MNFDKIYYWIIDYGNNQLDISFAFILYVYIEKKIFENCINYLIPTRRSVNNLARIISTVITITQKHLGIKMLTACSTKVHQLWNTAKNQICSDYTAIRPEIKIQ